MDKKLKIAIVGASGLVGQKVLEALTDYNFKIDKLVLYSSSKSAGKKVKYDDKEYLISELKEENLDYDLDIVFFCAGGEISREFVDLFVKNKVYVIDNSSAFRMEKDVPLVVPEVNCLDIKKGQYLIANPNCTTIQSVVPLKVIDDLFELERVDYSTYQAVSGSGIKGVNDLKNGTMECYRYSIKDNLIPLIDDICDDDYSKEEHKMINETRKILHKADIEVSATCIRVPIENGHAVAINVKTKKGIDLQKLIEAFENFAGIELRNDTKNMVFPLASEADGNDKVYIGRIKKDLFDDKRVHLYCVADNVRKGAAGNSVQIAEYLVDNIL